MGSGGKKNWGSGNPPVFCFSLAFFISRCFIIPFQESGTMTAMKNVSYSSLLQEGVHANKLKDGRGILVLLWNPANEEATLEI